MNHPLSSRGPAHRGRTTISIPRQTGRGSAAWLDLSTVSTSTRHHLPPPIQLATSNVVTWLSGLICEYELTPLIDRLRRDTLTETPDVSWSCQIPRRRALPRRCFRASLRHKLRRNLSAISLVDTEPHACTTLQLDRFLGSITSIE
jgi:hypothetical protein